MNKESILTEGFFDKIKKYFKDKKIRKKVANDPKVKSKLKDLNSSQQSLEDLLNGYLKDAGEKPDVKLSKYKAKDFIK
jgi:hypothetical protein